MTQSLKASCCFFRFVKHSATLVEMHLVRRAGQCVCSPGLMGTTLETCDLRGILRDIGHLWMQDCYVIGGEGL